MTDQPVRPVNPEAERYVLGACMISSAALDEVAELLKFADFYEPRHATIYAALRRLHDDGKPTDVVALEDELIRAKALVGNLDVVYLHQLQESVPTAANAGYYAGIVRATAQRRHLAEAGESIGALVSDASVDVADALEQARDYLDAVDETSAQAVEAIGDWFLDYAQGLAEKPSFTPTPWFDINQVVFGFRDGGLYIIAARPGDGKSIMAVQIARHFATHRPVLFVSLEMKREEIAARAISAAASIFIGSLNKHQLTDSEWRAFAKHRAEIEQLPLVIVGADEVATIPQLKAKVRAVERRFKRKPVVIVDYLQLLSSPGKVESRQVEVAGFSRSLKLAAQQWDVPVVALSQLNRGSANRKGKAAEPQLHDLRESGAIEQDADVVFLLHRKKVSGASDELLVRIAKNRQGQEADTTLTWQGQFSRVIDKTSEYLAGFN